MKKILTASDLSSDLIIEDNQLKVKLSESDNLIKKDQGIKLSKLQLIENIKNDQDIQRVLRGEDITISYGKDVIIKDLSSEPVGLPRNNYITIPMKNNADGLSAVGVFHVFYTLERSEVSSSNELKWFTLFKGRPQSNIPDNYTVGEPFTMIVVDTPAGAYSVPLGYSEGHRNGFRLRRYNDSYHGVIYIRGIHAVVQTMR